jgi:hypothetical protein
MSTFVTDFCLGLQEHPRDTLPSAGHMVLRGHSAGVCLPKEVTVQFDLSTQLSVPGSALRIGWGSEGCDLDSPVGFNAFGWSLKSTDGCIYNRADSTPYARAPILNGDVIGCLLHMAAPVDGARPPPTGGR